MEDKARDMVLASFVGDALSLGVHWIYNTNVIDKKWGRVETYIKPERPTFHPTKDIGEFTHYGDQTLVLLRSVAEQFGFDKLRFAESWKTFFDTYDGYFDGATKSTLANIEGASNAAEGGSESDDFAGAARIAPLVYYYRRNPDQLVDSVRAQTRVTHNHPEVIDTAEFFARTTISVLAGNRPTEAVQHTLNDHFNREPFRKWVDEGVNSAETDTRQAMLDLGQKCEVNEAFPCTIHVIAKYEDNLKTALIENIMAGGDSAARGLAAGMVLGAYLGSDGMPPDWLSDLKAYSEITDLLDQIDSK